MVYKKNLLLQSVSGLWTIAVSFSDFKDVDTKGLDEPSRISYRKWKALIVFFICFQ